MENLRSGDHVLIVRALSNGQTEVVRGCLRYRERGRWAYWDVDACRNRRTPQDESGYLLFGGWKHPFVVGPRSDGISLVDLDGDPAFMLDWMKRYNLNPAFAGWASVRIERAS